ncbi:MAG TPA: T9SS type A sorting domain-containing protein [Candidatus Kryptonia bacterium]
MNKVKLSFWSTLAVLLMGVLFGPLNILAQTNYTLKQIAGFEGSVPSFWNMGNHPSGSTLTWATDQSLSMGHSIEIQKSATSDSASWISDNMCDIWSPTVTANVDLLFGAMVKTSGVNTSPTSDDQKWYIAYSFYDSAGTLIGTFKLPIDQTQATSTSWIADTTSVGEVSLPRAAWKMILSFVGGKNATGTVWADNFIFTGRGTWAGQDWNTSLGVPTGWYYWLPPNGGNDGLINSGFENTVVTNSTAHSGNYSLEFNMPAGRDAHDGYVGTHRLPFSAIDPTIKPGDVIQISVWIKGSNLLPDSAAAHPTTWSVGITPQFVTKLGNNDGYDGTGSDYNFTFPNVTSFDWTKYTVDVPVPTNPATSGLEIRLHVYSTFTGTVYFDDMSVTKISNPTFSEIAGFEANEPAFWYMGNNPGNSTMSWATDQSVSLGHSLKIQKGVTSDSAAWVSENMCDIWSPDVPANVDLLFGAWVKTQNVNTNPTSDDQKWYIAYTFYDTNGVLIGTVELPINQSLASSSTWIADTTTVGQISLPKDAYKMILSFVGGRNATGTVWADNFIFTGRGTWAGQDWNTSLGVPTGWYYWLPPNGGNDGLLNSGFENTVVTNEAAHSGSYSLKFVMPAGRDTHDGFVSTHRMPFTYIDSTIHPGDYLTVGIWIKASNLLPDSAAAHPGQWGVGITPQFFTQLGNNDGFSGTGPDSVFTLPAVTSFDWTQFFIGFQVPSDKVYTGAEFRIHIYSLFSGTVYFDDMTVQEGLTGVKDIGKLIPAKFEVFQNYPNPFNPTTTVSYALPNPSLVKVVIYDILGREVKTLVDDKQGPGVHNVIWGGLNNSGQQVASGIYIIRVTAGSNVQVKKMLLLK